MLYPKLSNCPDCNTIPALIGKIDCKIAELSNNLYNNTVFILNKPVNGTLMNDLLNYRRILSYKYCNPDYANCYSVNMIASRVNLLTAGAKNCNNCGKTSSNCDDKPSGSTTTTTSSSSSTTSSTSSTTSSTSSTTSTTSSSSTSTTTSSSTSTTSTSTTPRPRPYCDTVLTELGSCLSYNGGFDYNLNDWSISGGDATWSSSDGGTCGMYVNNLSPEVCISQDILQIGSTYRIQFDILKLSDVGCDPTLIYINVFAGTEQYGPILQDVVDGTVHVDVNMVCNGNTTFKICAYNPQCPGGPFLYIDNICVTAVNLVGQCDINLFIVDQVCDPCSGANCIITADPIPATTTYDVTRVGLPSYSVNGTAFRSAVSPTSQNNGENNIIQVNNTGIWANVSPNDSTNGPLNRCAIQLVTPPPPSSDDWFGHRFATTCIDPQMTGKTFCIGVGGDNFILEFLEGNLLTGINIVKYVTTLPDWNNPLQKTEYWNVYEITLPANIIGPSYIGIWGQGGPFGFEVYDQPMSSLVNATTIGDLNIIHSSADITSLQWRCDYNFTNVYSGGPVCKTGFIYDGCSNKCVAKLNCPDSPQCPQPCTPGPLPNPRLLVSYYGNIEMTYDYVGPTLEGYAIIISCGNLPDVPNSIFLGNNPGAFTYNLHFSEPINDIQLLATGGGAIQDPGVYEEFTFNTNAGQPTLISCDNGCNSYIADNVFYSKYDNFVPGGLSFRVNAPQPFTTLTITGPGGLAGCIFGFCSKDVQTLYEQFPLLYQVKSIYTHYDVFGAPPLPPDPEPNTYSIYTNYDI